MTGDQLKMFKARVDAVDEKTRSVVFFELRHDGQFNWNINASPIDSLYFLEKLKRFSDLAMDNEEKINAKPTFAPPPGSCM